MKRIISFVLVSAAVASAAFAFAGQQAASGCSDEAKSCATCCCANK